MTEMGIKLLIVVALIVGLVAYFWPHFSKDPEPPVYEEKWWGKTIPGKKAGTDDVAIRPFTIQYKESEVKDLLERLNRTRLSEPLESTQFQYGFNTNYLKEILEYWKTKYDWKKQVKELNKYNHYLTQIEGLSIHYVHVKPKVTPGSKLKVLPLMIIHGWPGSFVEFQKIIPLLTTPREGTDFVFEVICPSIPGFGFSEAPHQEGFNIGYAARIFTKLMTRLNHKQFIAQGGDWGAIISAAIAISYPERLIGAHFNMIPSISRCPLAALKMLLSTLFPSYILQPGEKGIGLTDLYFLFRETGYFHIQATKPDTVGVALGDSPAGLAAYILEKFSTCTDKENINDPQGGLTKKFTMDELLTNVMVYWVTNTITSSTRIYKENFKDGMIEESYIPFDIPSGLAIFPNELYAIPLTTIKHSIRNIVQYSIMERGGHFAAMEEPKLFADDLWKFAEILQKKEEEEKKKKA